MLSDTPEACQHLFLSFSRNFYRESACCRAAPYREAVRLRSPRLALRQIASSPRRIRVAAATGRGTLAPLYAWLEKTRRRLHGAAQIEPACLYRDLATTAKPHRDQVRAVSSARFAHLIRIGSLASAVDVISIGTTVVR